MDFKQVYQLPLRFDEGIVFTKNGQRAFDFANRIISVNGLFIGEESQNDVVTIINGKKGKLQTDLTLTYENAIIYSSLNDKPQEFIIIRGWGYLTATGGLNLSDEVASKIQDDFAEHIIIELKRAYHYSKK